MTKSVQVGDIYEKAFSYSQEDVNSFAKVTGDTNPLHLDADYASKTPFKKPIMHGIFSASVFSKMLGVEFPGEGTVYLNQEVAFLRPMYVDTQYKAVLSVLEIDEKRHQATISTNIINAETGKQTVRGKAVVMHKTLIG